MTSNQIALREVKTKEQALAEERRHNLATEGYTAEHYARSDDAALRQSWASASQAETAQRNAAINAINAETQRYAAETNRLSYQEGARHNQAVESETSKHNRAAEDADMIKAWAANTQAAAATSQAVTSAGQLLAYSALSTAQAANYGAQTLVTMTTLDDLNKKYQAEIEKLKADTEYSKIKGGNETKKTDSDVNYALKQLEYQANKLKLDAYLANLKGLEFKAKYSDKQSDDDKGIFEWATDKARDVINFLF